MSNNFFINSDTCFVNLTGNGLNPSLFPVGTANHLDINYNILPFLCDLLKATTDNNVSPVLTDPPAPFDISPFTDFTALTAVGDPRVSLGETMTQTYIYFLPRVITQTEVRQSGGTQVIDNYICNGDGVPIKKTITGPILLSLDLTGKKPYKYGSITVPPISSTYEDLMKIIYPEEVTDFVKSYVSGAKEVHAEYFVDFIKTYLSDWTVTSLDVFQLTRFIAVNLKKGNDVIYLKYYYDVANKVGCLLGLQQLNYFIQYTAPSSLNQAASYSSIIPDYKKLMQNPTDALKFKELVLDNYKVTPDDIYTNIFANTAKAIAYFNNVAAQTKAASISSVKVVQC
jgi:hypothetical protein